MEPLFYTKLAKYYDKIYHYIDYKQQADFILCLFKKFKTNNGNKLLDVACGTGSHIKFLKEYFEVVGLDKSKQMLEIARKKNPKINFILGEMQNFNLHKRFDVVLCYFNSILYNTTKEELSKTLTNFWKHLNEGGVLIFNSADKTVGVDSRKEKYLYRSKSLNILFAPRWNHKNKKLYIDIDFIVDKKGKAEKMKDLHVMGAFGFPEIKSVLTEIGFEANVFETNYKKLEQLNPKSCQAIFVCRKH